MNIWTLISMSILLVIACWTDIKRMRIPNRLTVLFAIGGIVYQVLAAGMHGLGWGGLGLLSGFVPLYIMNRFGGIGGGDVKWFGAFGMWMGPYLTLSLLAISIVFAGGIASAIFMMRLPGLRKIGKRMKWPWGEHPLSGGRGVQFPFMIAVAPGFITLLGKG
ncbi:A24 family peptidase [Cohnella lupini]|uniref:Flp pilus assembly protein protease CpaA n=1 Tax=Cohnella lupini TaxID=1294267 RepID=A0A3D9HZC3_9BACL|nr:prepilin peptidase [Cohnella lupini]RED54760.1 Flp pilus assembly protein protease CpaA [Cohnella lupini]